MTTTKFDIQQHQFWNVKGLYNGCVNLTIIEKTFFDNELHVQEVLSMKVTSSLWVKLEFIYMMKIVVNRLGILQ